VPAVKLERALRFLDALDCLAFAVRNACAGYWGLRLACAAAAAGLALAAVRLAGVIV
jgi:hypothetical protein